MTVAPGLDETFAFTPQNEREAVRIAAQYPPGRLESAVIPLLQLAQRQNGHWLSCAAMNYVADVLQMPRVRVYEVATFYKMFNLQPVGRYHIKVCCTTPCWLRGSDAVMESIKRKLGIDVGQTTADGMFTLSETECLGACTDTPCVHINGTRYERMTPEAAAKLVDELAGEG